MVSGAVYDDLPNARVPDQGTGDLRLIVINQRGTDGSANRTPAIPSSGTPKTSWRWPMRWAVDLSLPSATAWADRLRSGLRPAIPIACRALCCCAPYPPLAFCCPTRRAVCSATAAATAERSKPSSAWPASSCRMPRSSGCWTTRQTCRPRASSKRSTPGPRVASRIACPQSAHRHWSLARMIPSCRQPSYRLRWWRRSPV